MKIQIKNLDEAQNFGIELGQLLKPGDIVCLNGELGAGKTTLTQSIGKGLGVEEYITSPTFTLINEYKGRVPVYHFDVYRLENVEELYDLGFDEYFYGNGISIIEWAERIKKMIPQENIVIDIENGNNQKERIFHIDGYGKRYKEIIEELRSN